MKKMYKRFLALVVMATLIVCSNVTCFAAELNESSDSMAYDAYVDVIDFDVCEDDISNEGIVELVINEDGTVNRVEPRDQTFLLNASGRDENSTTTWSNEFHTDRTGKLHIVFGVEGSCHINVKLRLDGSIITTNFVNENISNKTAHYYSQDNILDGAHVKVILNSFSAGANWQIRAWVA